jgi:hypothetical protein
MPGKIRHGHDRVPAFGRQFHVLILGLSSPQMAAESKPMHP